MDSPVNEIKNRLDLVEVVREYIPQLKAAGSNWKGLCPFHSEKTPSFMVSQDKQIWHCFGCSEGGDMFTFVMKMNGFEFPDALRLLADKAGVTLKRVDPTYASLRNKLIDMHLVAHDYYQKTLWSEQGAQAQQYLKRRGLKEPFIKNMALGISTDSWDAITRLLQEKGYTEREILASGLVIKSDRGKQYDRFRNRLMFPLIDAQGQIIGFAGRALDDSKDTAKYINSPQTALYNKSSFLYGFHLAKKKVREKDAVIAVEGYFDWLSLFQAGYENVIAVSGTAFTSEHVQAVKRFTKNIICAFDADSAGEQALMRATELALTHEMNVYTVAYGSDAKGAKDPDEIVRDNPVAWAKLIQEKRLALDYFLEKLFQGVSSDDVVAKKKALESYLEILAHTRSAVDREHFMKRVSEKADVSVNIANELLAKLHIKKQISGEQAVTEQGEHDEALPQTMGWRLIGLLLFYPKIIAEVAEKLIPEQITERDVRNVYEVLLSYVHKQKTKEQFQYTDFKETLSDYALADMCVLKAGELYGEFSEDEIKHEADLLAAKLKEEHFRRALSRIAKEIAEAERVHNEKKLTALLKKHTSLTAQLSQLIK